ncbi:hypothetical protein [Niallia sp. Krafla_26]|uniref:hypothetical protein n=1 Tax=Niallia sp. Krafla_26 TaxID=3064703 RepID=UPI003D1676D3
MKKILLFFVLVTILLNFFSIVTEAEEKDLFKFLPPNATLVSPEGVKPYLLYDFNQDGQEEMIINFKLKANVQPNPSQYGVIVLRKDHDGWEKIWETQTQGVGLDYSGVTDITGDGISEYLFGVTIGASAGNILEIFKWDQHSLKKIAEVPYHRLELLKNEKVSLAVWQRYIADTYFVDVLTWNGEKLVLDEERYASYYPQIEKFFYDKLAKMDAWFYWYTLADAQIKANQFEKAKESIQKGTALAKKLSLSDVVENFGELKDKLRKKEKAFL